MSQASTERRSMRMHPRLLWDVITKQAGTVEKSILEAAMNSIDAGATKCDITITRSGVVVVDDGKGFRDRKEIEDFFETFGYPHEKGDATYGRFRMGRGQLFAFGANKWASRQFRMNVDIRPQENAVGEMGLGYDLEESTEIVDGCRIEIGFYEPLRPSQLESCQREIAEFLKYAQIPVTVNGKRVNTLPAEAKWSHQDETAYYDLKEKGTLDVYNLGVLVCRMPAARVGGLGGVVVSKKQLTVNFARNDIVSSCEVWRSIQSFVRSHSGEDRRRKPRLTDADREALAAEILAGEMPLAEIAAARVLTDVTGSHMPLKRLANLHEFSGTLASAPIGDRRGDKVHQGRMAFVVGAPMLTRFAAESTGELVAKLRDAIGEAWEREIGCAPEERYDYRRVQPTDVQWDALRIYQTLDRVRHMATADFAKYVSDTHENVELNKLDKKEKVAHSVLEVASDNIFYGLFQARHLHDKLSIVPGNFRRRELKVGESEVAQAWTDGVERIWINRNMLPLVFKGYAGWARLAGLLVHEYCHQGPSTGTHLHDLNFFEAVHDVLLDSETIGTTINNMQNTLFKEMKKRDMKISQLDLNRIDRATGLAEMGLEIDLPDQELEEAPAPAL